ncbi:MAG TPA: hypothetical protein VJ454_15940, partial [Steroidobacteraceae bacterium]|nr:hypothetical protein [Steroidobacteraceae bacterium]
PAAASTTPAAQSAQPVQPAQPAPPAQPTQPVFTGPVAPAAHDSHPSWQVVPQKQLQQNITRAVPTSEDKAYAEWFAWAKRGGAKAPACHAAAQGAFRALSTGHDIATAVRWATAAMASPPVPVDNARQAYCAWFSLANIDMQLDTARGHLFATAALKALDAGADATAAHNAGAAAAGLRR